jgi:hypothetical protein
MERLTPEGLDTLGLPYSLRLWRCAAASRAQAWTGAGSEQNRTEFPAAAAPHITAPRAQGRTELHLAVG